MIDPKKLYRTRDGREVRILMTDGGDWNYPVIAAYKDRDGRWWPMHLTKEGRSHSSTMRDSDLDLIEVKPRIKREVWVNVYRDKAVFGLHASKEGADANYSGERIACVRLTIDCEEGEGL